MMDIKIYQINTGRDTENVVFLSFDTMKDRTGEICSENYDKVFEGEVEAKDLEDIYRIFNIAKPTEYDGRSLSVSDVVEVVESDTVEPGFYYCDTIGYQKISFEPELVTNCCDKQTITVVMVEPGKVARTAKIGLKLEDMQKAVGGYIEACYPFEEEVCIVCNEEGKFNGMVPNRALYDDEKNIVDMIFGPFFICDCSGENFGSLNKEQLERYTEKYRYPEKLFRSGDKLVAVPYKPQEQKEKERGE